MNQPDPSRPCSDGRALRRFPGRTAADMAILRALDPASARAFERELERQIVSDRRHREHTVTGVDAGELRGRRQARWATGTGGGRRRRPKEAPDA